METNDVNKAAPSVDVPRLVRLVADHGYYVSRDYDALYDTAQSKSVVCFVDYYECRDIAATLVRRNDIEISARGIGYVGATSKDEFVLQCRRLNVEFIPLPNASLSHGDGGATPTPEKS